jgi:hypothetical protein
MAEREGTGVVIDCDSCSVRGEACADCVVAVMLGPPGRLEVEADERAALEVLARSGLVPRLRMVAADEERSRRAV